MIDETRICKIEADWDEDGLVDITFYFSDNPSMPYSISEFLIGSSTRKYLQDIKDALADTTLFL